MQVQNPDIITTMINDEIDNHDKQQLFYKIRLRICLFHQTESIDICQRITISVRK
ncbi:hypothetical protein OfM2_06780 [Lactovum odontotermitis]